MKIIKQNCTPQDAEDRSLPSSSFLVSYVENGQTYYDIVFPKKQVEMFDHYWDRYREGLKGWKQTEGRVNPKLWTPPKK